MASTRTEVIRWLGPRRNVEDVEFETLNLVDQFNNERLLETIRVADREVLHRPVAVVHKLLSVKVRVQRLIQGIKGQIALQQLRHMSAHHPSGERIDDERRVYKAAVAHLVCPAAW